MIKMSRKLFTPTEQEVKQIKQFLLEGKTCKEIGDYFGFSKPTISRYIKKHNLDSLITTKIKYEITPSQLNYIKRLSQQGAGYKAIAALLQVNEYVIRRTIDENQIKKNEDHIFIYSQRGKARFRKEHPNLRGKALEEAYQNEINKIIKEAKRYSFANKKVYAKKFATDDWSEDELDYVRENIDY